MRRLWMLGALAVGFGLGGVACSWSISFCYYGYSPFDGQTGVPLDAVITLSAGEPFPADLPDVARGVEFARIVGGNRVAVGYSVHVDVDAGVLEIIPDEPLAPNSEYEVQGIDAGALETAHNAADLERASTSVRFSTASAPTLIDVVRVQETLVLVFSEAVDVDDVDASLVILDPEGTPILGAVTGYYEDQPNLIVVEYAWAAVALDIGEYGGGSIPSSTPPEVLTWYRSEPLCSSSRFGGGAR